MLPICLIAKDTNSRRWDIGDIVKLIDQAEEAPKKRGPYKKKAA
jgi:hypothetical protein